MYKKKNVWLLGDDNSVASRGILYTFSDKWENHYENHLPDGWVQCPPGVEHPEGSKLNHYPATMGEMFIFGGTLICTYQIAPIGSTAMSPLTKVIIRKVDPKDIGNELSDSNVSFEVLAEFLGKVETGVYIPINNTLRILSN